MAQIFSATISHIDAPLFSGEVTALTVPGASGEMQVLAGHEAFISPLTAGTITVVRVDGGTETHDIAGGTLEVSDNEVTVLV